MQNVVLWCGPLKSASLILENHCNSLQRLAQNEALTCFTCIALLITSSRVSLVEHCSLAVKKQVRRRAKTSVVRKKKNVMERTDISRSCIFLILYHTVGTVVVRTQ